MSCLRPDACPHAGCAPAGDRLRTGCPCHHIPVRATTCRPGTGRSVPPAVARRRAAGRHNRPCPALAGGPAASQPGRCSAGYARAPHGRAYRWPPESAGYRRPVARRSMPVVHADRSGRRCACARLRRYSGPGIRSCLALRWQQYDLASLRRVSPDIDDQLFRPPPLGTATRRVVQYLARCRRIRVERRPRQQRRRAAAVARAAAGVDRTLAPERVTPLASSLRSCHRPSGSVRRRPPAPPSGRCSGGSPGRPRQTGRCRSSGAGRWLR